MTRVYVDREAALEPGAKRIVDTDRGEIGVFNVDGTYYALPNTCAHQGGPLCEGVVLDDVTADEPDVGERVTERFTDEKVIKCPWHGWEYYLDSGELAGDNQVALPTYDVVVDDGDVYVEL